MKITTLCENRLEPCIGLKASHGLSLFIEYNNKKYLYDLGQDDIFLKNAQKLGVNILDTDYIIISHGHIDHAGGLQFLPDGVASDKIYISESAFNKKIRIKNDKKLNIGINPFLKNAKNYSLVSKIIKLDDDVWLIDKAPFNSNFEISEKGLFEIKNNKLQTDLFEDELALVIKTPLGLIIISGCSHRGIINIIKYSQKVTQCNEIFCVIGGLHLRFLDKKNTEKIIRELKIFNISQFIIGHCTGNDAIYQLKDAVDNTALIVNNYVGFTHQI